jgi:hypothetical protein
MRLHWNFGEDNIEFLNSHLDADADTLDTAVTMNRSAKFRDIVWSNGGGDNRPHTGRRGSSKLRPHDKNGSQNGHGMLRVHAMNARRLWSTRTRPKTQPHRPRSTWFSVRPQRTARGFPPSDVCVEVGGVAASNQDEKGPETGQGDTSEDKTGQSYPEIKHDASFQNI